MFELPKLKYSYSDLEPYIDATTMEIHHTKHHQTYITNLNKTLELNSNIKYATIEDLLSSINSLADEVKIPIRNNGGGHWNHSFFWELLSPKSNTMDAPNLLKGIESNWGNLENFKTEFSKVAMSRFGSGWAWLIIDSGVLKLLSTPNQDNPLMEGRKAIIGLDVWEHAYYLKYQNRRVEYINSFWNILNWKFAEELYNNNS